LSSGCPQFFKSGTKEFNKETGWWGLQQNIAPAVKFSEAGLEYFIHGKILLFSISLLAHFYHFELVAVEQ